jgi:hypothetical protein
VLLIGASAACFPQAKNLFDFDLEETGEDAAFELGDSD